MFYVKIIFAVFKSIVLVKNTLKTHISASKQNIIAIFSKKKKKRQFRV